MTNPKGTLTVVKLPETPVVKAKGQGTRTHTASGQPRRFPLPVFVHGKRVPASKDNN